MQSSDPLHDHHLRVFSSPRIAVIVSATLYAVVCAALLLAANEAIRAAIQDLDEAWWRLMVRAEWAPLVAMSRVFDVLGGTIVTLPLRVGVSIWLAWRRRWAALATWLGVIAASEIFLTVLKLAYARPRPPDPLVATTGFAFPSGHAVAGAATAVALVIVLLRPGVERRVWEVRAAAFAVLMGLSRTYLRAHWLSDAVIGVAIGTATAIAVAALIEALQNRRQREPAAAPSSESDP